MGAVREETMKVLLVAVNAKYIHSNLGIYSLRAYAAAHGVESEKLELAEYTINQNTQEILADIYRRQPDMVAFSCYIWNIELVKKLGAELRQILPQIPIWCGGPEVSFDAMRLLMDLPWMTGIMMGEGEKTFLELYWYYSEKKRSHQADCVQEQPVSDCSNRDSSSQVQALENLVDILGIAYRGEENGSIRQNLERPKLSMDELVFPYEDMEGLEHRIVYYETSRGCPFGCSYCLSSVDRQVRLRSMALVERELQFFLDHKVPQVKFVDRTFNVQKEHTMAIWRYIYEHDNGITNFHFELSADLLTEEEIAYIRQFRPGLVQFEIGVQSTNPETKQAIHRVSSQSVLEEKVAKVYQARNIHQHLDLIAGLPYEDYHSFRKSFGDVYRMKPDQLQLGFLKVLHGSPIAKRQQEFGIVSQKYPPYEVLYTKWLSYEDVLRLKQVEDMVERYYNSMQFEATLPYLVGFFEEPFDFYQSLGEYFAQKGYSGVHQSRMQNYEILWAYCLEKMDCDQSVLWQLLRYDLYARENLKCEPAFLKTMPEGNYAGQAVPEYPACRPDDGVLDAGEKMVDWKEWKRRFYQNPLCMEQYLPEYRAYDWKQVARMTHMERFSLDIPLAVAEGKYQKRDCILLFDYQQRNPLSHQARIVDINTSLYCGDTAED